MLDIYYQNVRGMRTKTEDIYKNILLTNYDVIVFTESWLNNSITNGEFIDPRYVVYRRDRSTSKVSKKDGGGVMVAVSNKIKSVRMKHWESNFEDLWLSIELSVNNNIKKIALCIVYMPPPVKLDSLQNFLDNVNNVLNDVDDVVILGDFNLGFIDWNRNDGELHLSPSNYENSLGYSLIDFLSLNQLHQFNSTQNTECRILDLVLSNISNLTVTKPTDLLTKLDSHHPNLLVSIPFSDIKQLKTNYRSGYNFFKADYEQIKNELKNVNWNCTFQNCIDINEKVGAFYSVLQTTIDNFVPKYSKKKSKYPAWFSNVLIRTLSEKEKFRQKYRKYKNPRDRLTFELLRSRCHTLMNNCYNRYKSNIENDIPKNPKTFWRFIKDKRRGESCIPADMFMNDRVVSGGPEIASLFADQFVSVFSRAPANTTASKYSSEFSGTDSIISSIKFTENQVFSKLKHIDTLKGPGPDSMPPLFVKRCCRELALPLQLIFNSSLADGTFPDVWKRAKIVPVFKKGDPANVKNYRPISILSCFPKIFEALVCPVITRHTDKIISPNQHGFKAGRSVETNLVEFVSDITLALDKRLEVDAVYTDFSSAFDKVDHSLLLSKLQYNGIHGPLLNWFSSYLARRSQILVVNGYESYPYYADSGVPQGSHLAPVLFSLFINDITHQILHCKYLMFADDLKIYKTISSHEDTSLIQEDLDRIEGWCRLNHMQLNVQKCSHIRFSRKKQSDSISYSIKGAVLNTVTEVRDLGVIMDDNMNFRRHIDGIVTKSARLLGFLKRSSRGFKLVRTKIILYNALVRSHLEFASVVWNPFYAVQSQRVESIQRAFTKHLAYTSGKISPRCPYEQRIQCYEMDSLRDRRLMHDLTFFFKLLNNKLDCMKLVESVGLKVPYNIPRHPIINLYHIPTTRTNIGVNSPLVRLGREMNSVIKSSPDLDIYNVSINIFRAQLLESHGSQHRQNFV